MAHARDRFYVASQKDAYLDVVEVVAKLSYNYAYTVEEVAQVINSNLITTEHILTQAEDQNLVEVADITLYRDLTNSSIQIQTVKYYHRTW